MNNLTELNEILFDQLRDLRDAKDEELEDSIERAKGTAVISKIIVEAAHIDLEAEKLRQKITGAQNIKLPGIFNGKKALVHDGGKGVDKKPL
jgi:hypothetical protein